MATTTTTSNPTKPPSRFYSTISSIIESKLGRLFIGPVLFISFLFSLVLIDQKTSSTIFSSPHSRQSPPQSPGPTTEAQSKQGQEFYHSRRRDLAKSQLEDAFEMRGKMAAFLVLACGVGAAAVGWSGLKVWSFVSA